MKLCRFYGGGRYDRKPVRVIPGYSICWECMFIFEDFLDWLRHV